MPRVYAVKYAERDARRGEHFLGGDPHDAPMPMDYFVWAVVGDDETWVVDTGFGTLDATRRNRRLLRTAAEALATIGVDAHAVTDVILTHAHYDHAGGLEHFPSARFHVQEREMAFATGRPMTEPGQSHGFTADHVAALVHHVHTGRVVFHDGDEEVAPGLSLHLLGGHTDGMQVVRVETGNGALVLASDSTHYYENFETGRPFPIVYDVDAMVDGWATLRRLASTTTRSCRGTIRSCSRAIPAAAPDLEGVAVRLDTGRC